MHVEIDDNGVNCLHILPPLNSNHHHTKLNFIYHYRVKISANYVHQLTSFAVLLLTKVAY